MRVTLFSSGDSLGFLAIYWVNCTTLSMRSVVSPGALRSSIVRVQGSIPSSGTFFKFVFCLFGHLVPVRVRPPRAGMYYYVMYVKTHRFRLIIVQNRYLQYKQDMPEKNPGTGNGRRDAIGAALCRIMPVLCRIYASIS